MKIFAASISIIVCQCCFAQHWQTLGAGLDNYGWTTEMYTDSIFNKLYVAGPFTRVDGDTVWGIASWNGSNWDSLGHGLDHYTGGPFPAGNTWGMAHLNGDLYIGGNFIVTGTDTSQHLSRWNGSNWSTVPGGQPNSVVDDVIVYNNELYICGVFDSVGNTPANRVAKFDGTTWQCIGSNYDFGNTAAVKRMAFYHGNLYISGMFYDPQGLPCHLAKWDGTNWQFMTYDLVGGIADVWAMEVYDDELYVSGLFYASVGNAGNCIMRWNDTTWRDVGGGVGFYSFSTPTVKDMKVHNGKLYCVGNFERVGGITAMGLASWDGTDWCGYNTAFEASGHIGANNLAFYGDTLYVGGGFITAEGDTMNGITKWIGGSYVDACGNTTGSSELLHESSVSVFPNPASDVVTFQFENNEQRTIIVYDPLGREVWRKQTSELLVEFPACEFAGGMYFYSVIEDRAVVTGRILIEH